MDVNKSFFYESRHIRNNLQVNHFAANVEWVWQCFLLVQNFF